MTAGSLTGRRALVTGAASGIGLATVRGLGACGVRVAAIDLRPPAPGVAELFVAADVSSAAAWTSAVQTAEEQLGGLDIAVLNAGIISDHPLLLAGAAEIKRVVAVDLLGVILGVRAVVPALRRRGGGAIVATASLAGLIPYPPDPVYAAAKHGVVGFVRSISDDLARQGIVANVVCPGLTDTMILPDAVRAAVGREGFPLLAPQDVAAAVIGCVAGEASGQALVCQPGRPPVPYAFRGVPGPAGGIRAPA